MTEPKPVESWLTDMDGVLVREDNAIPGASDFITALRDAGLPFLVLTNNPMFTPRDLRARLLSGGIDVPEQSIWTSALATASFPSGPERAVASGHASLDRRRGGLDNLGDRLDALLRGKAQPAHDA
jgi:ribonucleotide monophosphatase NagD (HAD superfamily)